MAPKGKHPSTGDLLQQPLAELINLKHPLVKLSELIDWSVFETHWAAFFPSRTGRPANSPRLITGLLYLQHTFASSGGFQSLRELRERSYELSLIERTAASITAHEGYTSGCKVLIDALSGREITGAV